MTSVLKKDCRYYKEGDSDYIIGINHEQWTGTRHPIWITFCYKKDKMYPKCTNCNYYERKLRPRPIVKALRMRIDKAIAWCQKKIEETAKEEK